MGDQEEPLIRKIEHKKPTRLSEPRIPPLDKAKTRELVKKLLDKSEWDGLVQKVIEDTKEVKTFISSLNVWATLLRYKDLSFSLYVDNGHIMSRSSLPDRDREILILRIAWLCYAEYEWAQHVRFGKFVGLIDEEINRILEGPDAEGWDSFNSALIRSVDELYKDTFISDATWKSLTECYDTNQLMDLVFTVGQYQSLAMALNTFGVQLEEGIEGFPK